MEGHELVKVGGSPFESLPLFLPANASYDPATNTVTKGEEGHDNSSGNDEASHRLVKVPKAGWDMLEALQAPISVISLLGPYRSGKSFLGSRFLNTSNVFRVGPTLEGCTVGIWISTTALKDPQTGCHKFILDVEGLGDPVAGDDASNARMALACLLLSSVVLFNNTSHPDRSSLQFLRCLSTIRHRIPNANDRLGFPSFVWIFRDFFLQLPTRRDTGKPYTLQEYMLERVLPTTNNTSTISTGDKVETEVVDSLLNDFATLQVLKVGHPKRKGQNPLSPEEMAHLEDLNWTELDEGFRADIQKVIVTTLKLAAPFRLGREDESKPKKWGIFAGKARQSHAQGQAYAKWCETVLELVNSTGIIPNLPDLQQQLVQQMADSQLARCVKTFETELETYWEACPVYNNGNDDLVARHSLLAVAEEEELRSKATAILEQQKEILLADGAIPSPSILEVTLQELESRCFAIDSQTGHLESTASVSIYVRICAENNRRSQTSCEVLIDNLYTPLQASIRNDPTSMSAKEFQKVINQLKTSYETQARGPAKKSVLKNLLLQPSEADALFIAKVTEKDDALKDSLTKQASLSKDIQQKEAQLTSLHENLEQVKVQTKLEMEALAKAHENALQKALQEQQQQEQQQREVLRKDMEKKLQDAQEKADKERQENEAHMKRLEEEAQRRLKAEIEARDERLKREKDLFEKQMETLKVSADTELKERLEKVQFESRKEQERIEEEMTHRLEESESRLQEEIRIREVELSHAKEELEATKKAEQELKERLNRRICPEACVTM